MFLRSVAVAAIATFATAVECTPELSSPDAIDSLPVFGAGVSSFLSRNLSEDVWSELAEKKDAFGFSFKEAIYSGCKNPDSGVGVYAGSPDSYAAFASLFDPIISQYHKRAVDQKHVSDMNYRKLSFDQFPPEQAELIKSTRIRVARNLAGYPLGPGLTREQRLDIEHKVIKACSQFTGDLAGSYYSLGNMSDEARRQLIDDHFLFKEGDRFLEACNLNRDWPKSRGIYHNKDKTFLVWVNEEDHLRIISMQQGASLF